jgi:divalent metal cation (Fe/Co/Zn/Cd) transporter
MKKSLRPITILVIGPALAGISVAVVAAIVGHDPCTVRSCVIWFIAGAIQGAVVLAPFAASEGLRTRLAYLRPYTFRIQWDVSLAMAVALGYILAYLRQGIFDGFVVLAFAVVFIGAGVKVVMSNLDEPDKLTAE